MSAEPKHDMMAELKARAEDAMRQRDEMLNVAVHTCANTLGAQVNAFARMLGAPATKLLMVCVHAVLETLITSTRHASVQGTLPADLQLLVQKATEARDIVASAVGLGGRIVLPPNGPSKS